MQENENEKYGSNQVQSEEDWDLRDKLIVTGATLGALFLVVFVLTNVPTFVGSQCGALGVSSPTELEPGSSENDPEASAALREPDPKKQEANSVTDSCIPGSAGEYGDMFGVANALFSGLAFTAIVLTIYLQIRELRMQRTELRHQRTELEHTRKVFQQQQFQSDFFSMIKSHEEIMEQMKGPVETIAKGSELSDQRRYAFRRYVEVLEERIRTSGSDPDECYKALHDENEFELDLYFRSLANLLKFTANAMRAARSEKLDTSLKFFVSVIRSRISKPELQLLQYQVRLHRNAKKTFDGSPSIINEFQLFKHLDDPETEHWLPNSPDSSQNP